MDSPSIAEAVRMATPDVAQLLAQHAKWCAQMCRNLPSPAPEMCQNLPSAGAPQSEKRPETCRNAPEPAGTCHAHENGGTNPPVYTPAPRPLSDRQLYAARLIVRGHGSVEIARHLGVNRHTVAEWKRNPAFVIELQRLRAYLTAQVMCGPRAGAPLSRSSSASSSQPPPPRPRPAPVRMTRAEIAREDAECEAMVAQLLQGRRER